MAKRGENITKRKDGRWSEVDIFIRGRYVAKAVFQKNAYYLGSFKNYDDAVKARKKAMICCAQKSSHTTKNGA